jgi:glutathione S-transferase
MPELQLIGGPQSPYVWVCRLACAEKRVPYHLLPVMPHTPEVDAIHPFGRIPAMRHGEVTLCESRAICLYIDRAFDGPPLVPGDLVDAARVEQWISLLNTQINPLFLQYIGAYFFPRTPDGSPNRETIQAALPKLEAPFAVLDREVGATGHLVGKSFTLADMDLVPILYYLNKLPEGGAMLAKASALKTYFDSHLTRPSVAATIPPPMPSRG